MVSRTELYEPKPVPSMALALRQGGAAARRLPVAGWEALSRQPFFQHSVWQLPLPSAARSPALQAWRAMSAPASAAPSLAAFVERGPAAAERPSEAAKKPRTKRARKAVMEVTDRAKQRLAEIIAGKDPAPAGIRLGVRTRG
jgi:hypothetical protein